MSEEEKPKTQEQEEQETVEFVCPKCNAPLRVSDDQTGKLARCPSCGNRIRIPRS